MTRINRATFCLGILLLFALMMVVSTVSRDMPGLLTGGAVALALLGPSRLHDFGLSGWFLLAPAAAMVALLIAANGAWPTFLDLGLVDAVMLATIGLTGAIPGHRGINRYGAPQTPLRTR